MTIITSCCDRDDAIGDRRCPTHYLYNCSRWLLIVFNGDGDRGVVSAFTEREFRRPQHCKCWGLSIPELDQMGSRSVSVKTAIGMLREHIERACMFLEPEMTGTPERRTNASDRTPVESPVVYAMISGGMTCSVRFFVHLAG